MRFIFTYILKEKRGLLLSFDCRFANVLILKHCDSNKLQNFSFSLM